MESPDKMRLQSDPTSEHRHRPTVVVTVKNAANLACCLLNARKMDMEINFSLSSTVPSVQGM